MLPPDPTPTALPRLSRRRRAMLLEMGVALWWPAPDAPATAASAQTPAQAPPPAAAVASRHKLVAQRASKESGKEAGSTGPAAPRSAQTELAAPAELAELADLAELEAAIHACTRCSLACCRQRAVPGQGARHPDWLIIGEAPGEEEDRQGLPFVGPSGQLLERMLAAMALRRTEQVYISNVIKCRPPGNRNPAPAEIAQCRPYLLRQIELLRPKILVAMGRFAAQAVLGPEAAARPGSAVREQPLGKLRGRVHQVRLAGLELPLVVTYHPAYLLRSPAEKAKAWADLCLAMDTLEAVAAAGHRPP